VGTDHIRIREAGFQIRIKDLLKKKGELDRQLVPRDVFQSVDMIRGGLVYVHRWGQPQDGRLIVRIYVREKRRITGYHLPGDVDP